MKRKTAEAVRKYAQVGREEGESNDQRKTGGSAVLLYPSGYSRSVRTWKPPMNSDVAIVNFRSVR